MNREREPGTRFEQSISSERVYSGRVVTLEVDRVRLPNGDESIREVVRHPGASVILPIFDDGRIALIEQYRYAAGGVLLELPAGTLEPGEDPTTCAGRELTEETGWRASSIRPLGSFFTTPGFSDEVIHVFVATGLSAVSGGAEPDADEVIETVIMTVDEVFEAASTGRLVDSKTLATLLLARLHESL